MRGQHIVSEGFHESFGQEHAEVRALSVAQEEARGSTAYVSLEPCRHEGKTPPCTEALVEAGVARVVFWASDPGPDSGGGGAWLRERGLVVDGPFGDPGDWAMENPFFFHAPSNGLPYVAAKLAVSLDGGIAPGPGVQKWLTGPESQAEVHRVRSGFEAIVVGGGTWRADDPRLTVRGPRLPRIAPARVLVDTHGELPLTSRVFDELDGPVWVATASENYANLDQRLGGKATALSVSPGPSGLDPASLIQALGAQGARTVLCEGGGALVRSLLDADLIYRLYLFQAPLFLGEGRVQAFPPSGRPVLGTPATSFDRWRRVGEPRRFGDDNLTIMDRRI